MLELFLDGSRVVSDSEVCLFIILYINSSFCVCLLDFRGSNPVSIYRFAWDVPLFLPDIALIALSWTSSMAKFFLYSTVVPDSSSILERGSYVGCIHFC